MELKLSEEDFERLAATLERRITDRVVGRMAAGPAWDAMSERAKEIALMHIGTDTFAAEAVDAMRRVLVADGKDGLRTIVMNAVRAVHADDPELKKAVAKGVYEAARDHAERLHAPYDD